MDATIYDVDGKCTQESIYRIGKERRGVLEQINLQFSQEEIYKK